MKRETIRSDEIDFTGYGYDTANGRPRGRETYASLRVAVVVGIGTSDPPVLLFATSGSTSAGPPPAKLLSSLQPDADASECPPMRIHTYVIRRPYIYMYKCMYIDYEWKKNGRRMEFPDVDSRKPLARNGPRVTQAPRSHGTFQHHYTVIQSD